MPLIGDGSECCGRPQKPLTPPGPLPCLLGLLPAALTVAACKASQSEGLLQDTLKAMLLPALPIKRVRYMLKDCLAACHCFLAQYGLAQCFCLASVLYCTASVKPCHVMVVDAVMLIACEMCVCNQF